MLDPGSQRGGRGAILGCAWLKIAYVISRVTVLVYVQVRTLTKVRSSYSCPQVLKGHRGDVLHPLLIMLKRLLNIPLVSNNARIIKVSDQPPNKINWIKTNTPYIFACTSYCKIIIFMKRTFNKQINVVYIQFKYIERIILAIKYAKKKKIKIYAWNK